MLFFVYWLISGLTMALLPHPGYILDPNPGITFILSFTLGFIFLPVKILVKLVK